MDAPMASTRPFEPELDPSHFDQRRRLDSRQQLNPMESNPIESNSFGLGLGFEQSVEGVLCSTRVLIRRFEPEFQSNPIKSNPIDPIIQSRAVHLQFAFVDCYQRTDRIPNENENNLR
jgi:hypothetical protein